MHYCAECQQLTDWTSHCSRCYINKLEIAQSCHQAAEKELLECERQLDSLRVENETLKERIRELQAHIDYMAKDRQVKIQQMEERLKERTFVDTRGSI